MKRETAIVVREIYQLEEAERAEKITDQLASIIKHDMQIVPKLPA